MALDLTKLTPAPWHSTGEDVLGPPDEQYLLCAQGATEADCAFVALARTAFEVMMRRGWYPWREGNGTWLAWMKHDPVHAKIAGEIQYAPDGHADPFTALVEADAWWRANIEKRG